MATRKERLAELEGRASEALKAMERHTIQLRKILDDGSYKEAGYESFEEFVLNSVQGNQPMAKIIIEMVNERSHCE